MEELTEEEIKATENADIIVKFGLKISSLSDKKYFALTEAISKAIDKFLKANFKTDDLTIVFKSILIGGCNDCKEEQGSGHA